MWRRLIWSGAVMGVVTFAWSASATVTGSAVGGASAVPGDWSFSQSMFDFFKWLLDPTWIITAAFGLLGKVFGAVGALMGGDIGDQANHFGDKLAEVPFAKLFAVGVYLMSPLVNPTLLTACIGLVIQVWVVTRVVRLGVYISSWIWPNPT